MRITTLILLIVIFSCNSPGLHDENPVETTQEEQEEMVVNTRSEFNIIGHRGGVVNGNIIENSLKALETAMNKDYEQVEIDIRFTSDGIPIVHHDAHLKDLYDEETTPIASLSFQEVQDIKSNHNGSLPYSFEEFAVASDGQIGFLLDFKDDNIPRSVYDSFLEILTQHGLQHSKVAWSKEAKDYFYQKESIKIGLNYFDFSDAIENSAFESKNYFLIVGAFDFNKSLINKALDLGVEVVVSVNEWSYKQRGITNREVIGADIQRMIDLGVRNFLIDATFEPLFNFG